MPALAAVRSLYLACLPLPLSRFRQTKHAQFGPR